MHGPHFLIQAPDNPAAQGARAAIAADYAIYSRFAHDDFSEMDYEDELRTLMQYTARSKIATENALFAYLRLQNLPRLRAMQDELKLLDVRRLEAIDTMVRRLGTEPDPGHLAQIDDLLVDLFTPTKARQEMPGPSTITRRLKALLAVLNPPTDFDPENRKERRNPDPGPTQVDYYDHHDGQRMKAGLEVSTDPVVMETFRARAQAVAREEKVSEAEAVEKLLCGEADPKIVLYGYTPHSPGQGPVYLQGCGWVDADGMDTLDEWLGGATVIDLDEAREQATTSYTPTPAMRAFAVGRDGVCIYPGCDRPAENCQLDHRIPFDAGGPTTPGNLFSLCQHHHNEKTDKKAFYVPDPHTGEIVWLFPDGTYLLAEPEGVMHDLVTPTNPRWACTVGQKAKRRAKNTEFFAKGDKILDDYRSHRDLVRCQAEIAALEAEYGMDFPYEPDDLSSPLDRIKELLG